MYHQPQFAITVSGGSAEENMQLTSLVHEALAEKGFTNLAINHQDRVVTQPGVTVFDLLCSMNPELREASIHVAGESEDDIQAHAAGMIYARTPALYPAGDLYQPVWLN